jgi:F0F1-type ATP synthase membrane subunit b/b'
MEDPISTHLTFKNLVQDAYYNALIPNNNGGTENVFLGKATDITQNPNANGKQPSVSYSFEYNTNKLPNSPDSQTGRDIKFIQLDETEYKRLVEEQQQRQQQQQQEMQRAKEHAQRIQTLEKKLRTQLDEERKKKEQEKSEEFNKMIENPKEHFQNLDLTRYNDLQEHIKKSTNYEVKSLLAKVPVNAKNGDVLVLYKDRTFSGVQLTEKVDLLNQPYKHDPTYTQIAVIVSTTNSGNHESKGGVHCSSLERKPVVIENGMERKPVVIENDI